MNLQPEVRSARLVDRAAILATVRAAFVGDGHDAQEEVDIVEGVWSRSAEANGLDLVAIRGGEIVGYVLGSWGDLAGAAEVGIAPLAVCPAHQHSGVGTALMEHVIQIGASSALSMFLLLGEPAYYRRFGFQPAERFGIWYQPAGRDNPHFMVLPLPGFSGSSPGQYRYAWER